MMHSLYLFPAEPDGSPPLLNDVGKCLRGMGLLGNAIDQRQFLVGEHFFRHVSFAGCSPAMKLAPTGDNGPFVHIKLLGVFPMVQLFTSSQYSKPRCPECRCRLPDWQLNSDVYHCPDCKAANTACALLWRNYAAWGRVLIEIQDIFPGEALPSDALLDALMADTDREWQYGWAESSV